MSALKRFAFVLALVVAAVVGAAVPAQAAVRPHEANVMHRLYNPYSGEHFYTANVGERDATVAAGWRYEGVGWYAPKSGNDVYRLYNPNAGDHHYTMNANERDVMVSKGWIDEGVGWFSDRAEEVAVWRQYNPNAIAGAHNFSTSKNEHISLCRVGWRGEGIGWYGVNLSHTASLEAREPESAFTTGKPISRDAILDALGVRAWVDDIPLTDLSGVKVDDGGLSDAAANDAVGHFTVTLTLDVPGSDGADGTTVTKTIDVILDGPCDITYAVASNLATSSGGTVHPTTERIASRLFTTEAQGSFVSAASGFSLDGWYAETIANGGEPTTGRLGSDGAYKPTVEGSWPSKLLFTAYLRADTATPYAVNHHLQRLNDAGTDVVGTEHNGTCFALDETDSETGTTGLMTQAQATSYYGYTVEPFEQQVVAGDGSTVIDIYYLRDTFTAVYDANGHGNVPEPVQVPFDALIPQPADSQVSAVGYNIDGWSHDTEGEEACDFAADTVATPVTTIYADWSSKTYTVILDHADGTSATETVQVGYGQTPEAVDVPLYNPWIFCGYWRVFPDGTSQQFTDNEGKWLTPWTLDEDNVTLTAMWATPGDAPYTVRHWVQDLNDAETAVAGTDKTITYEEVEGETVPVCADYTQETGSQETLKSMVGTMTAAQAHTITGFAVCPIAQKEIEAGGATVVDIFYDRVSHTATFDANGHGTPPAPQTVPYGALLEPVSPSPVAGYEFLGWSVDKSDTYWDFADDEIEAQDIRLYAMWQSVQVTDWATIGQMMAEGTPSIMVGDNEVFFGSLPAYDAGSWKVSTPEQLAYVAYLTSNSLLPVGRTADITLTASLDMAGAQYCTGDMERLNWTPIAGFAGTFDGAGKTISDLSAEAEGPAGLIGHLGGNAKVTNLVMDGAHAGSSGETAGAIVGSTNGHDLEVAGVYLRGVDVDGATYAGAYVGCADGGTCKLTQSSAHESGISGTYAGGLVGGSTYEAALELFDCVSANSYVEGTGVAGGALGWVAGAANVDRVGAQLGTVCVLGGASEGQPSVGGLVGRLTDDDSGEAPTFANVYATGTLEGIERAAGLVCADDGVACAIRNSYAATPTTIESGIYALATGSPQMQVCYYDSDLCRDAPEAEVEGVNPRGTEVMKRTTTAFYLNGSRFGEPWTITDGSNDGYPVFGALADTSPYPVSFDFANPKATGGTSAQEVWFGRTPDAVVPPTAPGFTFVGYYSGYDGEGTKYVDENGAWVRAWDQPEGATLYAMWEGNIITYVWPLSWLKSVPAKTLVNDGWTFYGEDEAKVLPMGIVPSTPAVTLAGWDISGDGIPAEANKTCVTSLPEGTHGRVRATAHYVLGPATTWDQTYLPMRDQVDGYPPLPSYDATNGGWQVANNVELAFVMGANTRGEMNKVRSYEELDLNEVEPGGLGSFASVSPKSSDAVLTADIDLTGSETYTTSLDTQVGWGGTSENPLLWVPTTTYRATFDGQAHSITTCKIRNTFNSMTAGSRFGESYYAQANATGFFRRLDSGADVHSFMLLSPDVYARNNAGGGRTAFSTTGAVAGLVEGTAKVHAVGVEEGAVTIYHVKNMHNDRVAGLVGTLRGTASIEDCYVRGTSMTSDVRNHNWRCQISQQAGICVASEAGATVRDTYYRGTMSISSHAKRNTVTYQSGAIVPRRNLTKTNGSVPGSGATIANCYVDTASSFPGGRVDGAVARRSSTDLKGRAFAFTLNNNAFGNPSGYDEERPWGYDEERNEGYPIIGELPDNSPYTVTLDAQGGTHGSGGASENVTFGAVPAAVVRPSLSNHVFAGYFTQPNGKGTEYVDRFGNWTREWDKPEGATLYALWDANMVAYDFRYTWVNKLSDAQLTAGDWVAYVPGEAKSLPSVDNVPKTPGVSFEGWYLEDEHELISELPSNVTVGGKVTVHAKYKYASTSETWSHVYNPINDNVEGTHAKPEWDAEAGRWVVKDGTELAWVMYAKQRGTLGSGHDADLVLAADVSLAGSEHSGGSSTSLLWEPPANYGYVFDGAGHAVSDLRISRSFGQSNNVNYGEGLFAESNSTGFVNHLSGSAQVKDVEFVNPNVYGRNTNTSNRTCYATTGTLAGLADGSVVISRVGIQGGTVHTNNSRGLPQSRAGGIAGTVRGSAQLMDCYVRGTTVKTSGSQASGRSNYCSSFAAGVANLTQSGAKAINCYFHGTCSVKTNWQVSMSGSVLTQTHLNKNGGSSSDSGATVTNCYCSTDSYFNGSRVDGKVDKTYNSTAMKTPEFLAALNGERTPVVWSRDASRNAGLPTPFAALG